MTSLQGPAVSRTDSEKKTREYVAQGVKAHQAGDITQAMKCYESALSINPKNADANNNKGIILQNLGRYDEAVQCLQRAAESSNSLEHYRNLAVAYEGSGNPDKALQTYVEAEKINPEDGLTLSKIGWLYYMQGNLGQAVDYHFRAIELNPDNLNWIKNISIILRKHTIKSFDPLAKFVLLRCLEEEIIRHQNIYLTWVSILHLDPIFKTFTALKSIKTYESFKAVFDPEELALALDDPFLLLGLQRMLMLDPFLERLLSFIRRWLLENGGHANLTNFSKSLAIHCFLNEYVYSETEEEKRQVDTLKIDIEKTRSFKEGFVDKLIVYGMYEPLYTLENCTEIVSMLEHKDDADLHILLRTEILEPLEERALKKEIKTFGSINNDISQQVRSQYEDNPYPRWKTIQNTQVEQNLVDKSDGLSVLVAGCGTGQEVLELSALLQKSKIMAVDLSQASIAYAMRKTKELGITNVEYIQADLLELRELDQQFDIITSSGVLHHLQDPLAGWRVLVDKLKDNGRMKICLYSEIARQARQFVLAQNYIKEKGYERTKDGIRAFRQKIISLSDQNPLYTVTRNKDFYSLSECRDLLFHVQEHRFTFLQIEEILKDLELDFLNLSTNHPEDRIFYQKKYPDNPEMDNLKYWHEVEKSKPIMFVGMYPLWMCKAGQKRIDSPSSWLPEIDQK